MNNVVDMTADGHPGLKTVEGLRLQPLVRLETGVVQGYEVLALLPVDVQVEYFFQNLSAEACLELFLRQLEAVSALDKPVLFFINLPFRVLTDTYCLAQLLQLSTGYHQNIAIEMQDSETLLQIDTFQRQTLKGHVNLLRTRGWLVWLDDLTPGIRESIRDEGFSFDGVKTSWSEISTDTLPQLVKDARKLGSKVLTEGIETQADLMRARASGAEWGQGFLWPEWVITFGSGTKAAS